MLNRARVSPHGEGFIARQHELRPMKEVKSVTKLKGLQGRADHPEMLAAPKRCNFCNSFNFLTVLVIRHCRSTLWREP